MIVKKFVGRDMQEAMKKIRRELGPDAVMLGSKAVRKKGLAGLFSPKIVEVTAVYEPAAKQAPAAPACADAKKNRNGSDRDLSELHQRMTRLQQTVDDFVGRMEQAGRQTPDFPREVGRLYEQLLASDVSEDVARALLEEVAQATAKTGVEPAAALEQLILERLGEPVPLKLKKFKRTAVMIAGPTGVGKTTTLVKLAGLFSCTQGLKVGLINTDTYRVAAWEQLKTYADIMDIPVNIAYSAGELSFALKTLENMDVVLVDTAGKSPRDEGYINELKELLAASSMDEVLLTLSINTGARALRDIAKNYAFLKECKVVVTKLDEVNSWGNALNIAVYTGKPITYVTTGQSVPDDIEQMDARKIVANILGQEATA